MTLVFAGENFDVLFSYLNGGLASYRYGGVEMIQMIPRPNFWRAPVDNDNGSLMQMRCGQWKLASMYLSYKYPTGGHYPGMHIPEIEVLDDSAKVTFTYAMPTTPATGVQTELSGIWRRKHPHHTDL